MTTPSVGQIIVHHRFRTFFAALLGTIALSLISTSLLSVWLNRTLTDTNSYVQTVTPLVTQPAVQTFVSTRISDQLLNQTDPADAAQALLPADQIAGKTPEQLTVLVRDFVKTNVRTIMTSPAFNKLWVDTNRSAQSQLVSQLSSNSPAITLNLHPAVVGALNLLKSNNLGNVPDKLELPDNVGILNLKGGSIDKAHHYYHWFQTGTWTLVIITLLLMVAAAVISVHHTKTIRRMLIGTATVSLIIAAILQAPSIVKVKGADAETLAAARAIAHVLFHNLQLAAIAIAIVCLVAAVGTKVYEHVRKR